MLNYLVISDTYDVFLQTLLSRVRASFLHFCNLCDVTDDVTGESLGYQRFSSMTAGQIEIVRKNTIVIVMSSRND